MNRDASFPHAWVLAALFLTVFAARALLISAYGHPLPFADEWDAGAVGLYKPYLSGQLSWARLLSAHNEHRFLTSRLLGLVEFELAGGWNVRFQMLVNAAIAAGLATWLLGILLPLVPARRRMLLAVVTTLAFALPIDFEASLMGMNAHFYLMIIFSIAALLALTRGTPLGLLWWSGMAWSALAYLSMASAALTPLVALIVVALQLISRVRRLDWREAIAALVLLAGTGVMLAYIPDVGPSEQFRAHSLWQFIGALTAIAALPLMTPLGIAFVHAPIFVHVWRTLRHRPAPRHVAWTAIAIAGWVAAQMISIAYNRALNPISARYLDIVLLALPISTAVILAVANPGRWLRATGAIWLLVIAMTISAETAFSSLRQAGEQHAELAREEKMVTGFLANGDAADIRAGKAWLSYPNSQRLIAVLSDPVVRSLVPDEIQPDPPHEFDRARLLLKGGFKPQIEAIIALLAPIAAVLASIAIGLWLVAGYRSSTGQEGEEGRVGPRP